MMSIIEPGTMYCAYFHGHSQWLTAALCFANITFDFLGQRLTIANNDNIQRAFFMEK